MNRRCLPKGVSQRDFELCCSMRTNCPSYFLCFLSLKVEWNTFFFFFHFYLFFFFLIIIASVTYSISLFCTSLFHACLYFDSRSSILEITILSFSFWTVCIFQSSLSSLENLQISPFLVKREKVCTPIISELYNLNEYYIFYKICNVNTYLFSVLIVQTTSSHIIPQFRKKPILCLYKQVELFQLICCPVIV